MAVVGTAGRPALGDATGQAVTAAVAGVTACITRLSGLKDAEIATLQTRNNQLTAETADLTERHEALQGISGTFKQRNGELTTEKAALVKQVKKLQTVFKAEKEGLVKRIGVLEGEKFHLQGQHGDLSERYKIIEAENVDIKENYDIIKVEKTNISESHGNLEKRNTDLEAEALELRNRIEAAEMMNVKRIRVLFAADELAALSNRVSYPTHMAAMEKLGRPWISATSSRSSVRWHREAAQRGELMIDDCNAMRVECAHDGGFDEATSLH